MLVMYQGIVYSVQSYFAHHLKNNIVFVHQIILQIRHSFSQMFLILRVRTDICRWPSLETLPYLDKQAFPVH